MNLRIEKILSKTGKDILKVNGLFIHSKYDPELEAKRKAEKIYLPHHAHIIFGYGCGHLVDALVKLFKFNEKVIVIDPLLDEGGIKVKKEHENLTIFNSTAIEDLNYHIKTFAQEFRTKFQISCLPNYDKLFPEQYKKILFRVKETQVDNQVNDATLIKFSEIWQRNFTDNLINANGDYNINLLERAYECPVIVVSGGPSLTKQMPLLRKIRNNVIVIAAGTTIGSLLAEDVFPDYIVSIDGSEINYSTFESLTFNESKLIYTMLNHPKIRHSFKSKGYVTDVDGWAGFSNYLKKQLHIKLPMLLSGSSVSHLVFSIAQYISSGPIALIGQDLAYTNNRSHADNNRQTKTINEEYLKSLNAFQVEGYYGDLVWTIPLFNSMKIDFETIIKNERPKVPFFNCTEGGIKINGFEQISFKEFCESYVSTKKVTILEHSEKETIKIDIIKALQKENELYAKLSKIFSKGLKVLSSNRPNNGFEEHVLIKLDETEKKSQEIISQLPIESIISPITMKVMQLYLPKVDETKKEAYQRVYNQTKDLYTELITAIQKTKTYNNEVLEKYRSEGKNND